VGAEGGQSSSPASEEGVPEPPREPRLKGVNRWPLLLRPVDVESCGRWELVGRRDRSRFQEPIEAVEGRRGGPPGTLSLLISLWIYAYSDGVSSAREVEPRCGYHPASQGLTGGGSGESSHRVGFSGATPAGPG
jgi:hypothetical protein